MNYQRISLPSRADWNDCTVITFAALTGIDYHLASDIIAAEGRKRGAGFRIDYLGQLLREQYGFELQGQWCDIKLKHLLPHIQEGTYYCCTRHHAFVVINGMIVDCNEPKENEKVIRVWKKQ